MDFSGFAVLLEQVYQACENENRRLRRELPFCVFQHAHVELLNAYLMSQQRFKNTDPLEAIDAKYFVIAKPIYVYIQGIAKSVTLSGETVQVNFPVGGTPRGPGEGLTSGSFGPLTAENHNAYECYFSPYVSQKLIERTLQENKKGQYNGNFGEWNPFPNGTFPAEGIPNKNLLGYYEPEILHFDAVNILENCEFEQGTTIFGLLCHSPFCMSRTFNAMSRLRTIETTMAVFTPENNTAAFIYKDLQDEIESGRRIADYNTTLKCPQSFGSSASNRANYFGYKRKRSEATPGSCMLLANNEEIQGFVATRNANFEMVTPFAPHNQLMDYGWLREGRHVSYSSEGRIGSSISFWIERDFTIQ